MKIECPPHHWLIETTPSNGNGRLNAVCCKCRAVTSFPFIEVIDEDFLGLLGYPLYYQDGRIIKFTEKRIKGGLKSGIARRKGVIK